MRLCAILFLCWFIAAQYQYELEHQCGGGEASEGAQGMRETQRAEQ